MLELKTVKPQSKYGLEEEKGRTLADTGKERGTACLSQRVSRPLHELVSQDC